MKLFLVSVVIGMLATLSFLIIKPLGHVGEDLHGYQWPIKFYEFKKQHYEKIEAPAVLLVGGSNLLYGVDSKAMTEAIGVPVYNFGLGASIGLELMLELSGSVAKPGDTVVLSLENELLFTNPYNAEGRIISDLTLQSLNKNLTLTEKLYTAWMAPWSASFSTLKDSKSERFNKIYQTTSLSSNGDLRIDVIEANSPKQPFPANQMTGIYSLSERNASIVRAFVEGMKAKNITVLAVPPARYVKDNSPSGYFRNELAISAMYEGIGVKYLSDVEKHSFAAIDMYDSPNHIKPNGRIVNTSELIEAIKPELRIELANNSQG